MVLFGLNTLGAILVAIRAGKKGRSAAGFFWLGFLLSALISFIVVLIISPSEEAKMRVTTSSGQTVGPVSCPFCKELIRPDANVCKHCGKDVEVSLGKIVSERQAKADFDAAIQKELAEARAKNRREQVDAFVTWTRKPRVRFGLIAGILIIVVAASAPFVVSAIGQANQMNARDSLVKQFGAWASIASECGPAPSGIENVSVPEDNQSVDFDADVFVKLLRSSSDNLTDQQASFVDCLASGLGEFQVDPETGEWIYVPGVQQVKTNGHVSLMRVFSELISETVSEGSFGGNALIRTTGFIIQVSGPAHPENTEMNGTWHVRVSKTSDYGSQTPLDTN